MLILITVLTQGEHAGLYVLFFLAFASVVVTVSALYCF